MSMYRIETAIKEYLDSQNWRYKHEEDKHRFIFGMKLDCDNVDGCMLAVTARDEEDMSCKAIYEFNVPEEARTKIVEYTTRANYGLFLGNFQMDLDDGEVLYQTAMVFYDHTAMQQEVRRLIQVAIHMAERYGQGFYDVIHYGVSPEDAVKAAEGDNSGRSIGSGRSSGTSGSSSSSSSSRSTASSGSSSASNEFLDLVAEMTDEQLTAMVEAVQSEQDARRRRREEEERRRAAEEAAKKAAPLSLKDKLRRLIGGDDDR
ncbi:MAG: YbjN domain-containing protein [Oscillospiraceae bacterium]|nr:YbjN domain-containing protein [Oscillospiraceae bacterium]